jgi:hypothetical protein
MVQFGAGDSGSLDSTLRFAGGSHLVFRMLERGQFTGSDGQEQREEKQG